MIFFSPSFLQMLHAIHHSFKSLPNPHTKIKIFQHLLRPWLFKLLVLSKDYQSNKNHGSLLGSKRNFDTFVRNVKILLGAGKGCSVRISAVVQGLDVDEIPWLAEEKNPQAKGRIFAKLIGN